MDGPQATKDPLLQPYFSRREEPLVDQGCVLWGLRVASDKGINKATKRVSITVSIGFSNQSKSLKKPREKIFPTLAAL